MTMHSLESEVGQCGLRAIVISRFLGMLGDKLLIFALPITIYQSAGSVSYSGLTVLCQWLPRILLLPLAARLLDRLPRRASLIAIESIRVAVAIVLVKTQSIHLLLAAAGLLSLLNACCFLTLERIAALLPDGAFRAKFQAKAYTIERVARLLGPAIGGVLLTTSSLNSVGVCATVCFALSLGIELIRVRPGRTVEHAVHPATGLWETVVFILQCRPVLLLSGIMMAGSFAEGALLSVIPKLVLKDFGGTPLAISMTEIAAALLTALLTLVLVHRRETTDQASTPRFLQALIVMYLCAAGAMLAPTYWVFTGMYALFIASQGITTIHIRIHRVRHIPKDRFATTMAILVSAVQAPIAAAGYLFFALPTEISSGTLVLSIVALGGISALMLLRSLGRLERRPADLPA